MERNNHLMIDLETLDTAPTGLILSIGACFFCPDTGEIESDMFYVVCDMRSQPSRTRSIDTIAWWEKQSEEARKAVFEDPNKIDIKEALHRLSEFASDDTIPWSNGATFDIVLLENAYNEYGIDVPWLFYNIRDVRTIVHLSNHLLAKSDIPFEGTKHNALADAVYQATFVSKMWQALRK